MDNVAFYWMNELILAAIQILSGPTLNDHPKYMLRFLFSYNFHIDVHEYDPQLF